MKWLVVFLVGCVWLSGSQTALGGQGAVEPKEDNEMIRRLREIRGISEKAYSDFLPSYFMCELVILDDGTLELTPKGYLYNQAQWTASEETKNRVLMQYRELVEDAAKIQGENLHAPIDILSKGWNVDTTFMGIAPYTGLQRAWVAEEYQKRPSSFRAVVELEAALVEKELGHIGKYRELLADAVERLDLKEFDFRSDIVLRLRMPLMLNFVRPEVCLVFLHATELRNQGESEQALTLFKTIVEHAPCSPLAWLALAEVKALDATGREAAAGLDLLTDFYPVFWGCTHLSLDSISRYVFKRRGGEILKLVSELTKPEE